MRGRISRKEFDALMEQYVDSRGADLLRQEPDWRGEIPEHTRRAAENAFRTVRTCAAAGAPLPHITGSAAGAAGHASAAAAGLKLLSLAVAASAVIGAGAYAVSPAVRTFTMELMGISERAQGREPAAYVIPDPGGSFTLSDEAVGAQMSYRWFSSATQELIVEIAYEVPEEMEPGEDPEVVTVGPLWGTLTRTERTQLLILRDGDVYIILEYFHADRDELLSYAERLVAVNS